MSGANKRERTTEESEKLNKLQREFEEYRASVPVVGSRRFPPELKKKVLDAVEEKVPLKAIYKACQITSTQVRHWQKEVGLKRPGVKEAKVPAKILDVVPNQPIQKEVGHDGDKLEIRIGRWNLQVRLEQADSCNG